MVEQQKMTDRAQSLVDRVLSAENIFEIQASPFLKTMGQVYLAGRSHLGLSRKASAGYALLYAVADPVIERVLSMEKRLRTVYGRYR